MEMYVQKKRCKINKKYKLYMIINIIIPIVTGAIIYYLMSPDVKFVRWVDDVAGIGFHISDTAMDNVMLRLLRNYFPDMLWGYSLVFALFLAMGNNLENLRKIFITSFLFTTVMELFQLVQITSGTFDVCDILFTFVAEAAAFLIIKAVAAQNGSVSRKSSEKSNCEVLNSCEKN